jgi:ribosome recycling factor
MDKIIRDARQKMQHSIEALQKEFATIRSGRATPALLNNVKVEYFGSQLPINQLATISVPESRLLVITPWDRQSLPAIERAILTSDLGLHPSSDGILIRLQVPAPTEERRRDLAKGVQKKAEGGRVAVRNVRREALETIEKRKEPEGWSDDEVDVGKKEVQKVTDEHIRKVDAVTEEKVAEIMEV